jgi:hypothetical protein
MKSDYVKKAKHLHPASALPNVPPAAKIKGKRSPGKHGGSDKKLSPAELLNEFWEYLKWVDANPFLVNDYIGPSAREVQIKRQRPPNRWRFPVFIWMRTGISVGTIDKYLNNFEGRYPEYIELSENIRRYMDAEMLDGALAGVWRADTVHRLLALGDKNQETRITEIRITYDQNTKFIEDCDFTETT